MQSVFLLRQNPKSPQRTGRRNQFSYYAKTLKVHTTHYSAAISLLGMKPKRTVGCNQSSYDAKTLKANTALQSVLLGMKPELAMVCKQSSY